MSNKPRFKVGDKVMDHLPGIGWYTFKIVQINASDFHCVFYNIILDHGINNGTTWIPETSTMIGPNSQKIRKRLGIK